jgi:hypothetical protein
MTDFILLDYLILCPGHFNSEHPIVEYVNFLNFHALPNKIEGITNSHHVLPKSICKILEISERLQNSRFNRVHLYTKDHIKAHIILWQCFKSHETAGGIGMIFNMGKSRRQIIELTDEEINITAKALDYFHSCEYTRLRARLGQLGKKYSLKTKNKMSRSQKEAQAYIDNKKKRRKNFKSTKR